MVQADVPKAAAQAGVAESLQRQSREIEEKHALGESLRTIYANRFDANTRRSKRGILFRSQSDAGIRSDETCAIR